MPGTLVERAIINYDFIDMSKDYRDNRKKEQPQQAYIYLVKTPSSNDLTVCASERVFYPGT